MYTGSNTITNNVYASLNHRAISESAIAIVARGRKLIASKVESYQTVHCLPWQEPILCAWLDNLQLADDKLRHSICPLGIEMRAIDFAGKRRVRRP